MDIYGRKTGLHLRSGTPLHMHLSDQRPGVWNIEAFRAGNEIILCAGLFDALTFWNAGYRNVSCTFGPDALTDDLLAAFREFGIRRVLLTAEAIAPKLLAAGLDCYLMRLPPGIDVNAYALEASDPSQALGAMIRKAEWLGKGQPAAPAAVPVVAAPPPAAAPWKQSQAAWKMISTNRTTILTTWTTTSGRSWKRIPMPSMKTKRTTMKPSIGPRPGRHRRSSHSGTRTKKRPRRAVRPDPHRLAPAAIAAAGDRS